MAPIESEQNSNLLRSSKKSAPAKMMWQRTALSKFHSGFQETVKWKTKGGIRHKTLQNRKLKEKSLGSGSLGHESFWFRLKRPVFDYDPEWSPCPGLSTHPTASGIEFIELKWEQWSIMFEMSKFHCFIVSSTNITDVAESITSFPKHLQQIHMLKTPQTQSTINPEWQPERTIRSLKGKRLA